MSSPPASLRPVELERHGSAPKDRFGPDNDWTARGLATFAACEVARRAYRWSRTNLRLKPRLERLEKRLAELPRAGVGVPTRELDPELDSRLAPFRKSACELVIGDFDQDGGILPRFGELRGVPSIGREQFMARTGCPVLLVDLDGRLGVRKEFGAGLGRFVQELEALVELEAHDCPVPRLMNVDWEARSITSTFVPGEVVRELLALAGADIRDRDARGAVDRSREKARVREGRELAARIMSKEQVASIAAGLHAIHEAGFVLEDVKFGNIILGGKSGEPVFLDLERALPTARLPLRLARHLREVDLRKLREHFGPAADGRAALG
jgi:hypothetical protein